MADWPLMVAVRFQGKDPTKVDRSGAYMARAIAKNIVRCGFAKRCQVAISLCNWKSRSCLLLRLIPLEQARSRKVSFAVLC